MIRKYKGELEVDVERGVIWFHVEDQNVATKIGSVTLLRICQLPKPIPECHIDITHMHGANYLLRPENFVMGGITP